MTSIKQLIAYTRDPKHGDVARKLLRGDLTNTYWQIPNVLLAAELDLAHDKTREHFQAVLDTDDIEAMVRLVSKGQHVSKAILAYRKELNTIAQNTLYQHFGPNKPPALPAVP